MDKRTEFKRVFKKYMRRTWLNKVYALLMILIAAISTAILSDATFLVFVLFIAIPLFFTKENVLN